MADSFFELKNSLNELEGEILDLEEDEYDALNDETFGSGAIVPDEDWEDTHNLLAAATESTRGREIEQDVEKSLSRLVLDDDRPPGTSQRGPQNEPPWPSFAPPLPLFNKIPSMPMASSQLSRIPTVEELERQMLEGKKPSATSPAPSRPLAPPLANPPRDARPPPGISTPMQGPRPQVFPHAPPPGVLPQFRPQNNHQFSGPANIQNFSGGKHGPGPGKAPGFPGHIPHPILDMGMRGKPVVRMPGQPNMGMFHGQGMPPHIHAQEYLMRRAQYEKMAAMPMMIPGMPLMPPRMMPPPGMFPPLHNAQIRNEMMFRFDGNRNQFHPPHPILYPQHNQENHQKPTPPNQNQLNWQQKQLYNRNSGSSERDEYAKLMNNRERTWLLNIQMMQLTSDKPHIDDYYYTMWKKKHPVARKSESLKNGFHKDQKRPEAFFANNRPNENHRERRDSENTTTTASHRVYVPLQFENSLGKIQAMSVIAPRVVLDVVSDTQAGSQPAPAQKDHRKTKKILLELERLYLLMIEAEEADEMEVNADVETDVTKSDLVHRVLVGFLNEERYLSFLCIRKGKALLIRCLGHVRDWDSPMFAELWSRLLKAYPTVLRRDKDDALLSKLYPFLKRWSEVANWATLMVVARSALAGTRDGRTSVMRASPCPNKPVLSYILSNQFGVSAVTRLLVQGESKTGGLSQQETTDWKTFVEELVKGIANLDCLDSVVKPLEPIPHNILAAILNRRCPHLSSHLHATVTKVLGAGS